jgi:hypothetical protein
LQLDHDLVPGGRVLGARWRGVFDQLGEQCAQLLVAGQRDLALEPVQQMGPPLAEVQDPRRDPPRGAPIGVGS